MAFGWGFKSFEIRVLSSELAGLWEKNGYDLDVRGRGVFVLVVDAAGFALLIAPCTLCWTRLLHFVPRGRTISIVVLFTDVPRLVLLSSGGAYQFLFCLVLLGTAERFDSSGVGMVF